ncbi:MAG: hypothetical protein SOX25_07660 [Eubacteriales bacterium]|nr:hypothetical protein [Eubacteriales bacterium]
MNRFLIGETGEKAMADKLTREDALALLQEKRRALEDAGEARYPRRADFSPEQVVAIKAFLGPWPRALETAGIKPPRDDGFAEKRLEKRIRQKRRRTALKIQAREKRDSLEHPGL